jgi:hypothetical protein
MHDVTVPKVLSSSSNSINTGGLTNPEIIICIECLLNAHKPMKEMKNDSFDDMKHHYNTPSSTGFGFLSLAHKFKLLGNNKTKTKGVQIFL